MIVKVDKKVHFTGIKGVGMAATALCYQDLGWRVSGSDVAEVFVTDEFLRERKIEIKAGFSAGNIDQNLDLLIYTGAHKGIGNPEVMEAEKSGVRAISQAEAVGELMEGKIGLSVCGVGGKTTSSGMIATVLEIAGMDPSYLVGVGGIKGLDFPGKMGQGKYFVAEADEYVVAPGSDKTPRFMYQKPEIIVVTNLAYDHPDVYENFSETKKAFLKFFGNLTHTGWLVVNGDDKELVGLAQESGKRIVTFGKGPNCDWKLVSSQKLEDGMQGLVVEHEAEKLELDLKVMGEHNGMNALAAVIACKLLKVGDEDIKRGLVSFGGTKRRLEQVGHKNGIIYLDDYAHHPLEIKATIGTVKDWYKGRRLVSLFQPHTFSRTKALYSEFAGSFEGADEVIITDIFASAREERDESVSGEMLARKIADNGLKAVFVGMDDLVEYIGRILVSGDVFLTMGAGDIYNVHEQIFKK